MSASCFWDSKNDGNFSKKYPFEDYYVIINVFGFARQWGLRKLKFMRYIQEVIPQPRRYDFVDCAQHKLLGLISIENYRCSTELAWKYKPGNDKWIEFPNSLRIFRASSFLNVAIKFQ